MGEVEKGDMGILKPPQIFLINIFCNYVTRSGLPQRKLTDKKKSARVRLTVPRTRSCERVFRALVHAKGRPPPFLNFSIIALNEYATFSPSSDANLCVPAKTRRRLFIRRHPALIHLYSLCICISKAGLGEKLCEKLKLLRS